MAVHNGGQQHPLTGQVICLIGAPAQVEDTLRRLGVAPPTVTTFYDLSAGDLDEMEQSFCPDDVENDVRTSTADPLDAAHVAQCVTAAVAQQQQQQQQQATDLVKNGVPPLGETFDATLPQAMVQSDVVYSNVQEKNQAAITSTEVAGFDGALNVDITDAHGWRPETKAANDNLVKNDAPPLDEEFDVTLPPALVEPPDAVSSNVQAVNNEVNNKTEADQNPPPLGEQFDATPPPVMVKQPDVVSPNIQAVKDEVMNKTEADQVAFSDKLPTDAAYGGPPAVEEVAAATDALLVNEDYELWLTDTAQLSASDVKLDEFLRMRQEELRILIAVGVQHLTRAQELQVLARWQRPH